MGKEVGVFPLYCYLRRKELDQFSAIAFSLLFALIGSPLPEAPVSELSNFQFSGPVYGLLRHSKPDLSLREIDERISYHLKSKGPISAITSCASDLGVSLFFYSLSFEEMASTPSPFLASIKRTEAGKEAFELVLVQSQRDDAFLVYQFRGQQGWTSFDKNTFKRIFGGSLLTDQQKQADPGMSLTRKIQIFLIGFVIMLVIFKFNKRSSKSQAIVLGLIISCCLTVSGCESKNRSISSSAASTVSLVTPSIQLGVRSQLASIPVVFRFKTGESEFTIEEVVTDCGCLEAPQDVKGKKFSANSEFELNFTLRTGKQVGDQIHWARISGLSGDKTKVLESEVKYIVKVKPEVSPEHVVLRRVEGEDVFAADALIVMSQLRNAPDAKLQVDNPDYLPFKIFLKRSEQTFSAGAAATRDDRFHIKVEANAAEINQPERSREIEIYIEGHDEPAIVRVDFETVQPIGCDNENVFLGFVEKSSEIKSAIRLNNRTDSTLDVVLESDFNFHVEPGEQIKLAPGQNKIPLSWSSGSTTGRNEFILFAFPKSMPSSVTRIKLSWIVNAEEEK